MLEQDAFLPVKAHNTDAGFDIRSRESVLIPSHGDYIFNTGVHIDIPDGYVGFLKSRSGLNVQDGITSEGVIDAGYIGPIIVKLYNNSSFNHKVNVGDKITQLVILPIPEVELEQVGTLRQTDRGENGIGSSGR